MLGVDMKKWQFVLSMGIVATMLILTTVAPVLAASGDQAFSTFINNLINWGQGIASAIAVLFLVVGGIKLKASQGNPQAQHGAKLTIAGAAAGLILVLFAKDIVAFITKAAGH
jgi:predicted small integral membrane protein